MKDILALNHRGTALQQEVLEAGSMECGLVLLRLEREMGTLNKYIAGRMPEERQPQKNEQTKRDRLNNPEKYRAKDKAKYEKHKEKIKDNARENYSKTKDDVNNRRAINITTCECGTLCRKGTFKQHERSNKHQEYLKSLEQDD